MLNEIRVHWALEECPSVLSLIAMHEDKDMIYLVLEYQPQGTLMNTMEKQAQLSECEVRMIMEQALLAMDYFTIKKIVHRDIKLDNILIKSIEAKTEYEVRIADFGLAAFTPKNELLK
jgi:serine/threonine protein kinase